jgi:hypothetical protein
MTSWFAVGVALSAAKQTLICCRLPSHFSFWLYGAAGAGRGREEGEDGEARGSWSTPLDLQLQLQ